MDDPTEADTATKPAVLPARSDPAGPGGADTALPRSKISIRDLDFYYGHKHALKHVSLEIPANQVTAIIGPSGCGKSTLLRVLNRIYDLYPDQRATGSVQMDGVDILADDIDMEMLRARIGMVFQQPTPFLMSIYDNIAFGTKLFEELSPAETEARVHDALARANLWEEVKDRLTKPAADLSGGQQQRLCIARAIASQPEVLLLDEPTGALDPVGMTKIEELIDQLKKTITLAIVTHNMEQAARCADQVAFMYLGELIEVGPAAQIFVAPRNPLTQNYLTGKFT